MLAGHRPSVEVDHGHPRLVAAYHPGLHDLVGDQLLQYEGGHVLVVLGRDVGKVALDGLGQNLLESNYISYTRLDLTGSSPGRGGRGSPS